MAFRFVGRSDREGGPPVQAPDQGSSEAQATLRGDRPASVISTAFGIGDLVRHRLLPFRGVIFDVDPQFAQSEEWWQSIPEAMRPAKDQPFYHLLAENQETSYIAYVSQQNLVHDDTGMPIVHPAVDEVFSRFQNGRYELRREHAH